MNPLNRQRSHERRRQSLELIGACLKDPLAKEYELVEKENGLLVSVRKNER